MSDSTARAGLGDDQERSTARTESHRDASRELDALIDERVFCYQWRLVAPDEIGGPFITHRLCGPEKHGRGGVSSFHIRAERRMDGRVVVSDGQRYSTDIAAAWLVVEKLADLKPHPWAVTLRNFRYYGDRSYSATFRTPQVHVAPVHSEADSPAEAICRAALAAVEAV